MTLLTDLALRSGLSTKDVRRLITTAPRRYKIFPIAKRNGGVRLIAQPATEIKLLQRLVIERVLSQLPVHESAYAYVRGRSIRANALRHAKSDFILKLDFRNFFNSIRPVDLERVLLSFPLEHTSRADFESIYNLCFWGNGSYHPSCLSIGAPSSPIISNIVMFDFDRAALTLSQNLGLTYTRYADDITLSCSSGTRPLLLFENEVPRIIQRSLLNLELNPEKRGLYGRGERRMVTGLIITPDGRVSIGRERKRLIRSSIDRLIKDGGDDHLRMWCKGMISFVLSSEPSFIRSLYRTYGPYAIRSIARSPNVSFYDGSN